MFSILCPVYRPPALLPFAVDSVLSQTLTDWELFIVCDGAPPETVAAAESYSAQDPRIKVRAFPKGERNGEAHRHTVLQEAEGTYVAQIGDDDIWLPTHLAAMSSLLAEVEFGHFLEMRILPGLVPNMVMASLEEGEAQRILETSKCLFGPTVTGYRMETYRRLPEGWSPAPQGIASDAFMWKKFLRLPDITIRTCNEVHALKVPDYFRSHMSIAQRRREHERLALLAADVKARESLVDFAFKNLKQRKTKA
ncbi:glycosyltransferase family 2 protein [Terrihabitans soli]|uniref:glycosyltransferase family 2 protein n=1 Tax=Terrihabitans soli TaxID=708113 RepID=UPI001CA31523|nr:glycosyltransferase family A protein [Terrihabitans soli]